MTATLTPPTTAPDSARPAVRHRRPGWRDPRALVGLLIVAASVLAGVKILSAADDTVAVWAVSRDLPAGTRIGTGDLEVVRMRFVSSDQADRYLSADRAVPSSAVLSRAVGEGEVLPRAALTSGGPPLVEVPLAVVVQDVPDTLRRGSTVDVWIAAASATAPGKAPAAVRVLDDVVVLGLPAAQDTLAPSGTRQVIVGVTQAQSDGLGVALGQAANGRILITRQG